MRPPRLLQLSLGLLLLWLLAFNAAHGQRQRQAAAPSASPLPENLLCQDLKNRSQAFDRELYAKDGVGGALDPQRVNWTRVLAMVADRFIWQDYSVFPSNGHYTDPRSFWPALNADQDEYPLVELPVRMWWSCDPFHFRLVAQWRETYSSRAQPERRQTSASLYITEFDSSTRTISRQAWWTTGNLRRLFPTWGEEERS